MAALPSPGAAFHLQMLGAGVAARLTVNPFRGSCLMKAGPVWFLEEPHGYRFVVSDEWVERHHSVAARALAAIESIAGANNGYADIGPSAVVAAAVQSMGNTVVASLNLHGCPTYRAFTKRAQECLAREPFGRSTYAAVALVAEGPDYEGAILARQEAHADWL